MITPDSSNALHGKPAADRLQSLEAPFKRARIKRDEDEKSNRVVQFSLYTNETLDDLEDLPLAGSATQRPQLLLLDSPAKEQPRPPFTERLIVSLLDQIKALHQKEWKKLDHTNLPDFFSPSLAIIDRALQQGDSATNRLTALTAGLSRFVKLCGDEPQYAKVRKIALKIISGFYVGINALKIHQDVLEYYTPSDTKPSETQLEELFFGVPISHRPPIVTELGQLWGVSLETSGCLDVYIPPNLPNQLFEVTVQGKGHHINFFRLQSPETKFKNLSPFYELFLDYHQEHSSRHLSLITLSPSIFTEEQIIADIRFRAQDSRPESLFAWRFEPDSDFAAQDNEPEDVEALNSFLKRLSKNIIKGNEPAFEFPKALRKDKAFANTVKTAISDVRKLLFPSHEKLSSEEKRDFILMTVVLLMEKFCEQYEPSTVDTACRSHIDRGIMVSSVLYVYLKIKSGNDQNQDYLEYLNPLILAPALTVAQRPPHKEKMTAILSLITRMLHPSAVKKIRQSQTYFSNCELEIPKATL